MLETFFVTVNEWIAGGTAMAAAGCFLWGLISVFFSPCHLASIPLIIAYVAGQQRTLKPGDAVYFALLFTLGLFITIAGIGVLCALLGRMLGDIGTYSQILIGVILVWVALGMLGMEKLSMSGSLLSRLKVRGPSGAFLLGLAYGVLSGSCTFGFIAPILAIITVQQRIASGILFILLFAVGHCIPIVLAGTSTAAVRRLLENRSWQGAGKWFRRGAGVLVGVMGIYFIVNPFFAG